MSVEHNHGDGGKIGHKYLIKLWPLSNKNTPITCMGIYERKEPDKVFCGVCKVPTDINWWAICSDLAPKGSFEFWRLDILRPLESSYDVDSKVETIEEFLIHQPVLV